MARTRSGKSTRTRFPIFAILICAVMIAADQVTKFLAVKYLNPDHSIQIIKGVLSLTYVENNGIAWGLFGGGRWAFVALTLVVVAVIVFFYFRIARNRRLLQFSLLLILSGALGNMYDRAVNGYVVDFFYFEPINFPVFNVADSFVVVGTILFALLLIFGKKTWTK